MQQTSTQTENVISSHKMGLKSLRPMQAAGKEVSYNHYVFHLSAVLFQLPRSF